MAFNLVFLRAHNVLIQQRGATSTPPLRVAMYKLLIHLEMMPFNYLNLVQDWASPGISMGNMNRLRHAWVNLRPRCVNLHLPQIWASSYSTEWVWLYSGTLLRCQEIPVTTDIDPISRPHRPGSAGWSLLPEQRPLYLALLGEDESLCLLFGQWVTFKYAEGLNIRNQ